MAVHKKTSYLRSYLAAAIGLAGVLFCIALYLGALNSVSAQDGQNSPATRVKPNEGSIVGGPNANLPATPLTLQCQGCHAPGKTHELAYEQMKKQEEQERPEPGRYGE